MPLTQAHTHAHTHTYVNNNWFECIRVQVSNMARVTCEVELPVQNVAQTINLK